MIKSAGILTLTTFYLDNSPFLDWAVTVVFRGQNLLGCKARERFIFQSADLEPI
jgi:hypothetical protein